LLLGLALLVVTTSGVPLLWEQEIVRAQHADAYQAAGPSMLSLAQAQSKVTEYDDGFEPQSFYRTHGVIVADNFESGRRVTVDSSNGRILGDFNSLEDRGTIPWTMSLLTNVHLCMLTCEEYVGYQVWLSAEVPVARGSASRARG